MASPFRTLISEVSDTSFWVEWEAFKPYLILIKKMLSKEVTLVEFFYEKSYNLENEKGFRIDCVKIEAFFVIFSHDFYSDWKQLDMCDQSPPEYCEKEWLLPIHYGWEDKADWFRGLKFLKWSTGLVF